MAATIVGTNGDDLLFGTAGNDVTQAYADNDELLDDQSVLNVAGCGSGTDDFGGTGSFYDCEREITVPTFAS